MNPITPLETISFPGEGSFFLKAQEIELTTWIALAAITSMATGGVLIYCHVNAIVSLSLLNGGGVVLSTDVIADLVGRIQRNDRQAALEEHFWPSLLNLPDFPENFSTVMLNAHGRLDKKVDCIVENFAQYRNTHLDSLDKDFLKNQIIAQIGIQTEALRNLVEFPGHRALGIYSTVGDGSCAFHALLGSPKNGRYRCDMQKTRAQFCDWMERSFEENKLPNFIIGVLEDYLAYLNLAPKKLQDALVEDIDELRKLKREGKKEEVLEKIFPHYLEFLKNPSNDLLIQELVAVAICFQKTLMICKPPECATDEDKKVMDVIEFNPGYEQVFVWHNGHDHYEHCEIINWDGDLDRAIPTEVDEAGPSMRKRVNFSSKKFTL